MAASAGRPDAVIAHQHVQRAEALDRSFHQRLGGRRSRQVSLNGVANFRSTFRDQFLGFGNRVPIIEDDLGPGANEQAHGRGPDAPRASRDQGHFSFQR